MRRTGLHDYERDEKERPDAANDRRRLNQREDDSAEPGGRQQSTKPIESLT